MPRISSSENSKRVTETMSTVFATTATLQPTIHELNSQKQWNSISFVKQLEKLEQWSHKICYNLIPKGNGNDSVTDWSRFFYSSIMILLLWGFVVRVFLCETVYADENMEMLLLMGDLSLFYGKAINRHYYNIFLLSWGTHAAVMYTMISSYYSKNREWLQKLEDCWLKSSFRAARNPTDNNTPTKLVTTRIFITKLFKTLVIGYSLMVLAVNIYGARKHFQTIDRALVLYAFWSVIQVFWCAIASIINFTSLFHHHIMCKAITIRFNEARNDLELLIAKTQSSDPWIISRVLTKHYTICDMVIECNRYLKNYLFIFYITFVPHLCFLVYQLFFSANSLEVKGFVAVYVLADALQILVISLSSAKITSIAHSPYHTVHGTGKLSLPEDVQLQVTLFSQRLSGTAIGLTILDTFVLTGGVISSICTAIVTYFSIIVEMN